MELERFDTTNCSSIRGHATISISKTGIFMLSKKLVKLLSLSVGDKLSFAHERGNPKNWFFIVGGKKGFELKESSTKNLFFPSAGLGQKIKLCNGYYEDSVKFLIMIEPEIHNGEKLYPIKTSKNLNNKDGGQKG